MDYSPELMILFILGGILGFFMYKDKPCRPSKGLFDYLFGDFVEKD